MRTIHIHIPANNISTTITATKNQKEHINMVNCSSFIEMNIARLCYIVVLNRYDVFYYLFIRSCISYIIHSSIASEYMLRLILIRTKHSSVQLSFESVQYNTTYNTTNTSPVQKFVVLTIRKISRLSYKQIKTEPERRAAKPHVSVNEQTNTIDLK